MHKITRKMVAAMVDTFLSENQTEKVVDTAYETFKGLDATPENLTRCDWYVLGMRRGLIVASEKSDE